MKKSKTHLTVQAPTPQNGQTHSNNSSANCRRIVWVCLTILWAWRLKGSVLNLQQIINRQKEILVKINRNLRTKIPLNSVNIC